MKNQWWYRVGTLLAVVALAGPGHAAQDSGSADQKPTPNYLWIQDRFTGESKLTTLPNPDQSLWNPARVKHYENSLLEDKSTALGILTIRSLNIQVPIYNGTDEWQLTRGAGRIQGMGRMHGEGNLGISSHRDGFFRGLKDIDVGTPILIQTPAGVERFQVADINIVPKDDVSVLNLTDERMLTLVTCYPFYFVGNAPERMIITALPIVPPES